MTTKRFTLAAAGSLVLATLMAAAPSPSAPPAPKAKAKAKETENFEPKFTINSPPAPALTPQQELATFKLPPGFHAELVACEPMVEVPVAMQFDPDGRLWVVEMRAYMPTVKAEGQDAPIGRVSVLEDTDGDGACDKSTVFLDNLVLPRAIGFANGGVMIGTPPKLLFAKDTNGDLKADEVTTLSENYGTTGNPEHKDNGLVTALDNWMYNAKSAARYKFVDGKFVQGPTFFRGQWGIAQDDVGRLYYNSNSDVLRVDVTPSEYLTRNPNFSKPSGISIQPSKDQSVWPGRVNYGVNRGYKDNQLRADGTLATVTAACGPAVYRGDLFPAEFRGNAFVCEPSGNTVMRKVITENHLVPSSKNPYDRHEFMSSTDERFRPVSLYNAPDGALYVLDIYHGILQERGYITPYLAKQIADRKLAEGNRRGRIWRIVPDDAKPRPVTKLGGATPAQLVELLSHPNGWYRDTAQRLLVEKKDASAAPLLAKVVAEAKTAVAKLHALWTLQGTGKLDADTVTTALADADPRVRATAIRVAEQLLPADAKENNGELFDEIVKLVDDAADEVQLQLACTVAGINKIEALEATTKVVKRNLAHAYIRDAAVAGLRGRELEFAEILVKDPAFAQDSADRAGLLTTLAMCVANEAKPSRVDRLIDLIAAIPAQAAWKQAALLGGLAGDPAKKVRKTIQLDTEPAELAALGKSANAKVASNAARVAQVLVWPGKPGYREIKVTPLTPEEQARFEKGKTLYGQTCAACHQPNGQGQEGLAPPLADSEWAVGPDVRLARIVLGGLKGPVSVNGTTFDLEMPALEAVFDDQSIASILTYVRREWDHTADAVSPATIRQVRETTAGRSSQWTAKELERVK